jgi:hypothetical protein
MILHKAVPVKVFMILALVLVFGCKKKSGNTPDDPPPAEKKIKITYEIITSVDAFPSGGHNMIDYTTTNGSYLFFTYVGSSWKQDVTIVDNGNSSINLHVDLVLNGDKATATGKIYINDVLKVTATGTDPYYFNGHTQLALDVRYR